MVAKKIKCKRIFLSYLQKKIRKENDRKKRNEKKRN
jgi:hypothetical protein